MLDRRGFENPFNEDQENLKEWIIAVKLERNFTKQEIIALILIQYLLAIMFMGSVMHPVHFFQKNLIDSM